jgi:hypothetical protein
MICKFEKKISNKLDLFWTSVLLHFSNGLSFSHILILQQLEVKFVALSNGFSELNKIAFITARVRRQLSAPQHSA